ncbi:MAG: hypothetical protein IPL78_10685 [Chloroflexi bacterium]|nr:hypothetical protein [Chloroflexota bacterium]
MNLKHSSRPRAALIVLLFIPVLFLISCQGQSNPAEVAVGAAVPTATATIPPTETPSPPTATPTPLPTATNTPEPTATATPDPSAPEIVTIEAMDRVVATGTFYPGTGGGSLAGRHFAPHGRGRSPGLGEHGSGPTAG